MNEGVKILIERMKTNPDEFIAPRNTGASKWGHLIESYMDSLDDEDQKAIKDGYKEIHQQRFTEAVMKELLAPEEDDSLGKPWYTGHPSGMLSAGTTLGRSSVTLSTNPLGAWGSSALDAQAYQMEQMKLHLDAHKHALKEEEAQQLKKHKTLFGKLFNYS